MLSVLFPELKGEGGRLSCLGALESYVASRRAQTTADGVGLGGGGGGLKEDGSENGKDDTQVRVCGVFGCVLGCVENRGRSRESMYVRVCVWFRGGRRPKSLVSVVPSSSNGNISTITENNVIIPHPDSLSYASLHALK